MKNDKIQAQPLRASDGRDVPFRIEINPRARRLILKIDPSAGAAVAVAPHEGLVADARRFAAERVGWIEAQLARAPERRRFEPGGEIPFRGAPTELVHGGRGAGVGHEPGPPGRIVARGAPEVFGDKIAMFLRAEAKRDLQAAVARHSETLGVEARAIRVADTTSRWGSCTSKGRLGFSWRVILAPPFVLDYLAAHECAHLLEMNHSDRFWAHVERCVGDPKRGRRWLRVHGASLHAYGA